MTLLDFVVVVLAAGQLVDTWRNGSLFADARAFMEAKASDPPVGDTEEPEPTTTARLWPRPDPLAPVWVGPTPDQPSWLLRWADRLTPTWFAKLMECWYCLSHHTPWVLLVLFIVPGYLIAWPWLVILIKTPVYSLAVTRVIVLTELLSPDHSKLNRND